MINIFTALRERAYHGKQPSSFKKVTLEARAARGEESALLRLKAVQGNREAISQVVEEAKKNEKTAVDVLTSELQPNLQGFEISDIGHKQKRTIGLIFDHPALLKKLTPNNITKLALKNEELALKAIHGEIRAFLPGDSTQNHNLNNINITELAEKFFSVVSVVLNTSELLNKLTNPQLSRLRKAYQSNAEIYIRLNDEIQKRAQLPPPNKRRRLGF